MMYSFYVWLVLAFSSVAFMFGLWSYCFICSFYVWLDGLSVFIFSISVLLDAFRVFIFSIYVWIDGLSAFICKFNIRSD